MTPLRLSATQALLIFPFFLSLVQSVMEGDTAQGGLSPSRQSLSPAGPVLLPHLAAWTLPAE